MSLRSHLRFRDFFPIKPTPGQTKTITREWCDYDISAHYPNLEDKMNDDCVVDLILKSGEQVNYCIQPVHRYNLFLCMGRPKINKRKYRGIRIEMQEISKIRLTRETIIRWKHHHWLTITMTMNAN